MKSFSKTIRSLHRDLGYFVIGLTLIYAITGIILSGRGLGWLEKEFNESSYTKKNIEVENFNEEFINLVISAHFDEIFPKNSYKDVKKHLKLKMYKQTNEFLFFQAWRSLDVKYEIKTGLIELKYVGYPMAVKLFVHAHKENHESAWFYLAILYSLILSFLAISSFWMVKGKNGFAKRGVYFMLAGFVVVGVFLYI